MNFIDLHTHNEWSDGTLYILNTDKPTYCGSAQNISVGLHPWNIAPDWDIKIQKISEVATAERVKAIGECGIDLIKSGAPIDIQIVVLRRHIELSEATKKPLILHIVKGQEHIIKLRKEMRPTQAWIVHGFRGKPEQAQQYLAAGFHLSFGEKHNRDSVAITPLDRIFLESDESTIPIAKHYTTIANIKNTTAEELASAVMDNCKNCGILF